MTDGLKSARLKLARAKKHLRAIKRLVALYAAGQPYEIARIAREKRKLIIRRRPPANISIVAGEMIYQMRSALDHLAFELVKKNANISTIAPNWQRQCQFPIRDKPPTDHKFQELPGISDKAFTVIDAMQPYQGPVAIHTVNGCLRALSALSNVDKHRRLNLTRPRVRRKHFIRYKSGRESGGWQVFDPGIPIEISRLKNAPDVPTYVNTRYTTLVAFDEAESIEGMTEWPIELLLGLILYQIEFFVVPTLQQLVANP